MDSALDREIGKNEYNYLPSSVFLALLAKNLLKTALEDLELCEEHLNALTTGWKMGKQAQPLFGIRWNTLWETPLSELQAQFNLN